MGWFTTEHPVLLATIRDAAATGADAYAHALPWTSHLLQPARALAEWAAAQHVAVAAAQRLGDDAPRPTRTACWPTPTPTSAPTATR